MNDLISRQDVLKILSSKNAAWDAYDKVKRLPSAQPERPEQPESAKEYCAECNHIEMCRWYPYEGCEFRSLPPAQPERKKGKWIILPPIFEEICQCSKCKMKFKDALQWTDYCPNCGADMRGESDE